MCIQIYIYSFSYSFPLWFITGYWIQLLVLYSGALLFIHSIHNSFQLLTPNSQSVPSPIPPAPLEITSPSSMSLIAQCFLWERHWCCFAVICSCSCCWVTIPQFIHPFHYRWTYTLFPVTGYYKPCCYIIFENISWCILPTHCWVMGSPFVQLKWMLPNCFPVWVC